MAGMAPFFFTGGNAKIVVNGRTLAFCENFTYQVTVPSVAPKYLGQYESTSIEPLAYNVRGSFSVIRYVSGAVAAAQAENHALPDGVSQTGNGIGNWGDSALSLGSAGGDAAAMLNPQRLDNTTMFDILCYQKNSNGTLAGVARIRSCRIVSADFAVNKRSGNREIFEFQACYLDEDSFGADFSGIGATF